MRSLNSFRGHEVDKANVGFSTGKKLNKEISVGCHVFILGQKMDIMKNMQQKVELSTHKSKTKVSKIFFKYKKRVDRCFTLAENLTEIKGSHYLRQMEHILGHFFIVNINYLILKLLKFV